MFTHSNPEQIVVVVDGGWSGWEGWTRCNRRCNEGIQTRCRYCNNPRPSRHGRTCPGKMTKYRKCKIRSCQGIKLNNATCKNAYASI